MGAPCVNHSDASVTYCMKKKKRDIHSPDKKTVRNPAKTPPQTGFATGTLRLRQTRLRESGHRLSC